MLRKWMSQIVVGLMLVAVAFGGYTLGLFSASTGQSSSTFATGTVRLGDPVFELVNITGMAPGDHDTYTYEVTYTGSLDAWIGLDTRLAGDLITCDGGDGLSVTITEDGHTYLPNANDQVVALVESGAVLNFTISYNLPLATGNSCQQEDAVFGMLVKAVQAANNTKPDNSGPISWGDLVSELDQTTGPIVVDTNGADQIPWAQTFTAGATGLLDKAEIYVYGPNDIPVTVTIRTVDGAGQPTDTILATATIPPAGITAGANLIPVTFTAPAPVTAGTQYAIYRTPVVLSGWSWNQPVQNDVYAAGQAWADRRVDLGYWESYAAYDLPFRTYVMH